MTTKNDRDDSAGHDVRRRPLRRCRISGTGSRVVAAWTQHPAPRHHEALAAEDRDPASSSPPRPPTAGNTAPGVQKQRWTTAFEKKTNTAFGEAFAPTVRLQASTLYSPIVGREAVQQVMAAATTIYESLTFTQQAVNGRRSYLEWEATAFSGVPLRGVTVLTKDNENRIVDVAIHHRPLHAALTFSRELGKRLDGLVPGEHFYRGARNDPQ